MTVETLQQELHEVRKGAVVSHFQVALGGVVRGRVLTKANHGTANSAHEVGDMAAYVTTDDDTGAERVAIGVANISDQQASMVIEDRVKLTNEPPRLIREGVERVMKLSDIRFAEVDPETSTISPETLVAIGFAPTDEGNFVFPSLTAGTA